ncbi:MAG: phenylalanine--tRNA ligase subunit alpha [Holosporaceae bacterium]|jgi:phenylalanyl-tRNA synthetase alpha chain|nr:phenylalanine--tRNA ligase subunit alpha [Holosporaceae bacterium]
MWLFFGDVICYIRTGFVFVKDMAFMTELDKLLASCLSEIEKCDNLKKMDSIRSVIFGKNGRITQIMDRLRGLDKEGKRKLGAEINVVKNEITRQLDLKHSRLELKELNKKLGSEFVDVSAPARHRSFGRIHPLTKVSEEIANILSSFGFVCADGPDLENEYYNFTALNMPDHHPARTMHDTFYVNVPSSEKGRNLLRTHTSPIQIHAMLANTPPHRFFSIGRVYRSDSDATHTPMFTQVEGLVVEKNVGFAHLKWIITNFLKKFFAVKDLSIRLRPSFFPFTEPSAEVDVSYGIKDGEMVFGCGDKWLEICGCGVVHPNVLRHGNVDADKYQGLAFGFGVERLTSLKYGISDLREYFESDDRWRNTFGFQHVS